MGFEFIPFRPLDYPTGSYQNGSSTAVFNLAPVEGFGYVPFGAPTLAAISVPLDTDARGGSSYLIQGVPYIFVGTTGRLYHFNKSTATLTNVSAGGGTPYATSSSDWGWSFTRWGNGVAATNFVDNVQFKTDITTAAAFATCFTSTLVPKAKYMGLVKNQLMIAHTNETATVYPQRVRWGAVDNLFDMDPSPTTQADYQDLLDDYGDITGFIGGEYGLVFKERAIYKASYVGPPLIYRFDMLASGIGTRCPGSIVEYKGSVYFWGANAIYKVNAGGAGVELAPEGIFKMLMTSYTLDPITSGWPVALAYDKTKPYLVHSVPDLALGCLYWAFPFSTSSSIKQILACSIEEGRSSLASPIHETTGGYVTRCIQGTYDGTERHIYAPAKGSSSNSSTMYCVDHLKRINVMEASTAFAPKIVSGFISPEIGNRAIITRVRPIFYSPGQFGSEAQTTPIAGVSVMEIGSDGIVSAENTFVADTSGNGWWSGKANGLYLMIATTFKQTSGVTATTIPSVCAGWEIVFDEIGSER